MTMAELLPSIHALPKADKLRLMQVIVADLAQEEGVPSVDAGASYPIYTPEPSFEAAAIMMRVLEEERAKV